MQHLKFRKLGGVSEETGKTTRCMDPPRSEAGSKLSTWVSKMYKSIKVVASLSGRELPAFQGEALSDANFCHTDNLYLVTPR